MQTTTPPTLAPGEIYAGVALAQDGSNTQHHLVLLPARPDKDLSWDDAKAWAASVGGDLPSPQEQSLLFANCRDALPKAWCWSNKEHEQNASFAWLCNFYDGYQLYDPKSVEGSAVAVRRLILESFDSSQEPATASTGDALSTSQIKAIRARLDRWELSHLRMLAAQLADQLDTAKERIDALECEVQQAWRTAEAWQEDATHLARDLQEIGATVGLTQGGQLVTMAQQQGGAA